MQAARRSIAECMPSERMLTDPLINPTVTFEAVSKVLDATDKSATLVFSLLSGLPPFGHCFGAVTNSTINIERVSVKRVVDSIV
jgi:hypothetical protein